MNTGSTIHQTTRRGVSIASIFTAISLLAALLLLSTAPEQESYRGLDAKLRYVHDVSVALDQTVDTAMRRDLDVGSELSALVKGYGSVAGSLQQDIVDIYEPQGFTAYLRRSLMSGFNAIGPTSGRTALDATEIRVLRDNVSDRIERMLAGVQILGNTQSQLVATTEELTNQSRALVRELRERGKDTLADEVFRSEQQILDRLKRSGRTDLEQARDIVARLAQAAQGLADSDSQRLGTLSAKGALLVDLRDGTNSALETMDFAGMRSAVDQLRQYATTDYVFLLSVANEARVLLNIYTLLLLVALGYFGFRLHRSHNALNRSHDDLELRVQDRTQDLQAALHDLQESQVQLVQAEKMSSLGQLVAGVMHEINTPLLYVLNNASVTAELAEDLQTYVDATLPMSQADGADEALDALQRARTKLADMDLDEIQENLEEMSTLTTDSVEGLNQISELVQSLKDYSRLDRAGEDMFDVREGLQKTLLITRNVLKYGIDVEEDFEPVPKIGCSPSKLNQVFTNLITNAAQAMDGKGNLKISTRHHDGWVEIVFDDDGCGIPEEHLSKIMDPFFTTKPVGQGTGLGLSIVHKIVEEHQGQILIDSKAGIGTRITLGFPVHRAPVEGSDDHGKVEAA